MDSEKSTQWVIQKIVAEDPGSMTVEWDTFNIGVIEEDQFRAIYSCWTKMDADFLLTAIKWYTSFKEGSILAIEPGKAVPLKKVPRSRKKVI